MALRIPGVQLVLDVPTTHETTQLALLEDHPARFARILLDGLAADGLELLGGDDRARAAGERGDDRDLVTVLEGRGEPLEGFDRLAVHVDVHVVVYLAARVAHEPLQAAVGGLELIQQPADVVRSDLDAVAIVGGPTERRRDVNRHGHA